MRAVRAKVTGNVLTLDEGLKDSVPPLLWLLDALPKDHEFMGLDAAERRTRTLEAVKRVLLRESRTQPLLLVFEDLHWIDAETQGLLDALVESLPTDAHPARGELPAGVSAAVGQQELLPAAPDRCPSARDRPRAPGDAARRRSGAAPDPAPAHRAHGGQPALPRGERPVPRRAGGARRGARRVPARQGSRRDPDPGDRPGDPGRAHRPPARRRQAPAPGRLGHRQGSAVEPCCSRSPSTPRTTCGRPGAPAGGRVRLRGKALPRSRVHLQARAHPRGGLRQPAARPAPRAPRPDRRRDRARLRGPAERAQSTASPTTPSGASCGRRPCTISGRWAPPDPSRASTPSWAARRAPATCGSAESTTAP